MKNIAIIGIGRWGKNLLREFNKITKVTHCYDKSAENREWLKKNYPNIEAAESYDEILNNHSIEAVVIATPIGTHFDVTTKALKAGKHVFVEKPITSNPAQAKKLVALAKKNQLTLFVGHIFLYHPIFQKIKRLVKNDPPVYAVFSWNKFGSFNSTAIWNLACHDIAITLDLFGKPKRAEILHDKGIVSASDVISLKLTFGGGRSVIINTNRVSNQQNKSMLLATKKKVYLWENDELYKLNKEPAKLELIFRSSEQPLAIECKEFLKNITKKTQPQTDGELGLEVVELISIIISGRVARENKPAPGARTRM